MSHPRCDGCRAVAGMFDALFRVEDAKIEHLGLELSLPEVQDIVQTVCTKEVFRSYNRAPYYCLSGLTESLSGRLSW